MKRIVLCSALLFAATYCTQAQTNNPDNRSHLERARELCSKLTLEEKVKLMEHESPAIERVGIPQWNWWSEALHGVGRNGRATVFPITMGLASTFDDALVQKCFDVVSTEARAKYNIARKEGHMKIYECLSFWTPNINIFRDPRWGRGQETYGEDPYLTSKMGLAVVRGLQGEEGHRYLKLYACAKHFAVHSGPEWNRHSFDVENLPPRDLWETYLPAFKELVTTGKVREVMCAYQRYDGKPCCGSDQLLQQILRKEWGFDGLVTSDCWAVDDFWKSGRHGFSKTKEDAISHALISGTDVECGVTFHSLIDAVKEGKVTEAQIDNSLIRLLKGRYELGDLDDPSLVEWSNIKPDTIDCQTHKNLALEAARRSIVLLQNNNNILPLKAETKVLVLGENAIDSTMQWGNYNGFPSHTTTILKGMQKIGKNVQYFSGVPMVTQPNAPYSADETELQEMVNASDVIVFVGGITPRLEGEEMDVKFPGFKGGDRTSIELPDVQRQMINKLHKMGKPIIYVNCSGSAVALAPEKSICNAIVQAWYGGQCGGQAVAEVLFGKVNPSGKLPVTFYASTNQLPDYEDYRMQNRTYRYFKGKPLWYFGEGMSYTTFKLSKPIYTKGYVKVNIRNIGRRSGEEVIQVYLHKEGDTDGPIKALRAFKRVSLKAGESKDVTIPFTKENFEWWDATTNTMRPLAGNYIMTVGTDSKSGQQLNISFEP
jgi:beta-glucosidase